MKGNFAILLLASVSFIQQATADAQMSPDQAFRQLKQKLIQITKDGIVSMQQAQNCLESAQQQEAFNNCLSSMPPAMRRDVQVAVGSTQPPSSVSSANQSAPYGLWFSAETKQSAIQFMTNGIAASKIAAECFSTSASIDQAKSCYSDDKPQNNPPNTLNSNLNIPNNMPPPPNNQLSEDW
jgi:hypothetical protein